MYPSMIHTHNTRVAQKMIKVPDFLDKFTVKKKIKN